MDVLVVVGDGQPPERLVSRAHHVVRSPTAELTPDVVADLRARIPREVGVTGPVAEAAAAALALERSGFPVSLLTDDEPPNAERLSAAGIRIAPVADPGPEMEVAGSLLDLVGNTPMVRLDRIGRDLSCRYWRSSISSAPAAASRTGSASR